MTNEEFEEYLISIGGIYNWRGINSTNPHLFGVGKGWFNLLKNLIDELISLGWDRTIIQSKQKFGGLNFSIKNVTQDMLEVIIMYEKLSYEICEVCGEKGTLRNNGWLTTLCDTHMGKKRL